MSTQTIELEPPLSVRRFLGLLLLSIALILSISTVTDKRITLDTSINSIKLKSIGTPVYAEAVPEILVPAKAPEPISEPKPAEVVQVPPPVVEAPVVAPEPPKPVAKPKPVARPITGNKLSWLQASNIPEADWPEADWLIQKESSWRPNAQNPKSTAFGLKQFLDSTWAGVGCTKAEAIGNPVYQLNCGQKYVMARYGSWGEAKAFWSVNHWY